MSPGKPIEQVCIPPGFIPHYGGKCPVAHSTRVEIVYSDGRRVDEFHAGAYHWVHGVLWPDIIAYRVIKNSAAAMLARLGLWFTKMWN
jgi:hypothetical protein